MDVANEILDAIEIIVDKKIRENTAQIYPGICKSVSGNSCVMSINGKDNTIQFYGSIPTVGAIYRVFVPDGNMSMAFAITGNDDRKSLHYSNPNLLDNWYFGNPVNQRGQTEYVVSAKSNAYTIDRWQMFYYAGSVSLENDGITISANAGTNVAFVQKHENGLPDQYANFAYRGMKATLSALASDGTLGSKTFTFPETYQGNTTVVSFDILSEISIQIYFHNTAGVMTRIYVNKGKSVTLKGIKLELGSQQTLAHQDADGNWVLNEIPDYGEQLARCQRYFVNFNPNKVNWFAMPPAVASNTTEAYSAVTLPVAMRAQPTVSYGGKIALSQTGSVQVTGIQVSGSTFAGNYLQLKYSVADGLTANSTYRVQGYNDPTSYIWLSADL